MRTGTFAAVASLLLSISVSCWSGEIPGPDENLFQVATLDALMAGGYAGSVSLGELRRHGGLGLGTFDTLDGEMLVLDGIVYQAKADGSVAQPGDATTTPFAAVTDFEPDLTLNLGAVADLKDLVTRIEAALPSTNQVYALHARVRGADIRARSVQAQTPPYRPLAEVVKTQAVMDWAGAEGDLVGFWCPQWLANINAPGLHLHFLSSDRNHGGHLLDIRVGELVIEMDLTPAFTVILPQSADFSGADLDQDFAGQTKAVEHQTVKQ